MNVAPEIKQPLGEVASADFVLDQNSRFRRKELVAFWRLCQEVRRGPDPLTAYDDLFVMAKNTDWPLLRLRCATMLA